MDTKITLTIPEENLERVINAIKGLNPIPQVNTSPEGEPVVMENEFTDNQWAKEVLKNWAISQVHKYENNIAKQQAKVSWDDTLIN